VRQVLALLKPITVNRDRDKESDELAEGENDSSAKKEENINKKSVIVALTARAVAGNKCISVAEIAKRNLVEQQGRATWQYTGCWTRLETYEPPKQKQEQQGEVDQKAGQNGENDTAQVEHESAAEEDKPDEEEEEAFETMQLPERKMVRNTVCLVIYLSTEPVSRLKVLYGEQVSQPVEKT